MIKRLADNIISPLGFSTAANYEAVRRGESGIVPGRDAAGTLLSLARLDREKLADTFRSVFRPRERYTVAEQALLLSVHYAVQEAGIDPADPRNGFVLSTTKGNIELLGDPGHDLGPDRIHLWHTAELLGRFFRNPNTPLTVSNACISGACAQIAAFNLLKDKTYDHVVVAGVDLASDFIISGFQSFKSLDEDRCRPFDARRKGLNLGEAAASLVYGNASGSGSYLLGGCIRNDANHISGPSRTGEGLYRALSAVMGGLSPDKVAFINAHGTATPFNDQMEAVAFARAGLEKTPVFSLKPHFGHTLGAAGVLESIISLRALEEGIVLPSPGYGQPGIEGELNVSTATTFTRERYMIKTLSGFGGGNAAPLFEKIK